VRATGGSTAVKVRFTVFLFVVAALAGCGSVETKESGGDAATKAPIASRQPLDSPREEVGTSPPFGRPKEKIAPSALDKRTESLTHDTPPH
jgi:hypothetical protein